MSDKNDTVMDPQDDESQSPDTLPWIEKYRPKDLSELVSHDEIVGTIRKLISANRLPHLLFYGPPGTGKTSTILAVAREMYGPKLKSMVLEMNASDARGIDTVRNEISNFAGTRKLFSTGIKLVILDEADNMTKDAQMALRRVIEKYTSNARFCIICNYASKIIPALQSRCTRFRFSPLKKHLVVGRVKQIIDAEKVEITSDGLNAVLTLGDGDMRKILNILQSSSMAHDRKVTEEAVYRSTGKPTKADIDTCRDALLNKPILETFQIIRNLQIKNGLALFDILTALHDYLMALDLPPKARIMILKTLSEIENNLAGGTHESLQLGALVGGFFLVRKLLQDTQTTSSSSSSTAMEVE